MRVSVNVVNQIDNAIAEVGVHEHRTDDTTEDRCRLKADIQRLAEMLDRIARRIRVIRPLTIREGLVIHVGFLL